MLCLSSKVSHTLVFSSALPTYKTDHRKLFEGLQNQGYVTGFFLPSYAFDTSKHEAFSTAKENKGVPNSISINATKVNLVTRMGMMWLGQLTTGRPLSMSSCLMCLTFLWWALRSTCPSGLLRTRTDSRAPDRIIGGRAVVKMKPAA